MVYNPSDPDYKPIEAHAWNPSDPGYSQPSNPAYIVGHTSKSPSDAFYNAWDNLRAAISAVITGSSHNLSERIDKLEVAQFEFQQALRELR